MNLFAKTSKYQKLFTILALGAVFLLPISVGAAESLKTLIKSFNNEIANGLIVVMISLAVVVLFWGIVKYIALAGDENERSKGKSMVFYGIIGLAVMVSIWGIINLIISFGSPVLDNTTVPSLPTLKP